MQYIVSFAWLVEARDKKEARQIAKENLKPIENRDSAYGYTIKNHDPDRRLENPMPLDMVLVRTPEGKDL